MALMKVQTKGRLILYLLLSSAFIFIMLFFLMKGVAISMFSGKEEEVVIFSPMDGKLTFEGKPVAGVKIVRWLIWKDNEGEKETFYTDENGDFSIPIKKDIVNLSPLTQFVMSQTILVCYEQKEIPIWVKSKRSKNEFGELGGKPKNFRCELTEKRARVENDDDLFSTSCKWDSIEIKGEK